MARMRQPRRVRVFGIPSASPLGPAPVPSDRTPELMKPVVRRPFSPGCIRSGNGFNDTRCCCLAAEGEVQGRRRSGFTPRKPPGRPKTEPRGARSAPVHRPFHRPNRPVAPLRFSHMPSQYTPSIQRRCSGVLKSFITFRPTRIVRTITDIVVGFIPSSKLPLASVDFPFVTSVNFVVASSGRPSSRCLQSRSPAV